MTAKTLAARANAFLIGCVVLAGCGQGASGSGSSAFNGAPPELKAAWDTAVAADKTNDYVPAVLGYKQILLQRDRLSPGCLKAAEEASGKLFQRLVEASTKGDPAARQALSQLQPGPPGRRTAH
ncbi:MAG: hypothetical protein ACLQM8_06575 [Limisphaerales bacterium]